MVMVVVLMVAVEVVLEAQVEQVADHQEQVVQVLHLAFQDHQLRMV